MPVLTTPKATNTNDGFIRLGKAALPLAAAATLFIGGCDLRGESPASPWPVTVYANHPYHQSLDRLYDSTVMAHSQIVAFSNEKYERRTDNEGDYVTDTHRLNPVIGQSLIRLRAELSRIKSDYPTIRNPSGEGVISTEMAIRWIDDGIVFYNSDPKFVRDSEGWRYGEEWVRLEICKDNLGRMLRSMQRFD